MNALGQFVFLRTYSRLIPSEGRRETYKEVCNRVVNYNIRLSIDHLRSIGYSCDMNKMIGEAELFFKNMFNLKQFCSGRCLPKGSLVHCQDGMIPIEDVKIGQKVLTLDGWKTVTDWFDNGCKKLIRIRTQDGGFSCTPDHRMPVLTSFNDVEWIKAKYLCEGDRLITSRVAIDGIDTFLPEFDYETKNSGRPAAKMTIPTLDADMAWLVGLFHADGYVHDNYVSITLGSHEIDMAIKAVKQFQRFGLPVHIRRRKNMEVNLPQKQGLPESSSSNDELDIEKLFDEVKDVVKFDMSEYFHENYEKSLYVSCGSVVIADYFLRHVKQSHTAIRIPSWILRAKHDVKLAYLAGVTDGDGSFASNARVVLHTVYPEFAQDVQNLLYSCGIESRLHIQMKKYPSRQEWKPIHGVSLITLRSMDIYNAIPHLHKQINIGRWSKNANGFPKEFGKKLSPSIKDKIGLYSARKKQINIDCYDREVSNDISKFCPVEVIELEDAGEESTYDLTVEDQHNFYCNGYLTHNTLWIGGTKAAEKSKLSNFNCSFTNIESWDDLADLFYALLVGTGVGFKCTKQMARNISKIRMNMKVVHSEYKPLPTAERLESSVITTLPNGYAKLYIGDSKEAWAASLKLFFNILSKPEYHYIHTLKISYNSIRPAGERLKTFGGTASGHEPLKEMFQGIYDIIKNVTDPYLDPIEVDSNGYGSVRPIHILDIGNHIGFNVVVGGVRRTSEIFLFDVDDWESLFAKYGINGFWTEEHIANHKKLGDMLDEVGIPKPRWFDNIKKIGDGRFGLDHRRMSNNSICFKTRPSEDLMNIVFQMIKDNGEPGFINLEAANKRRPQCEGINPCLTADSMIMTNEGLRSISSLVGKKFTAVVNGKEHPSTDDGFWKSGYKEIIKITLDNGLELKLTPNHKMLAQISPKTQDWIEAGDLKPGSNLVISDNENYEWKNDDGTYEEGYFIGQLIGEGTFYETKQGVHQPCIDLSIPDEIELDEYGPARIISRWAKVLSKHSDAIGFKKSHGGEGYKKYRMNIVAFREIAEKYGVKPLERNVYEQGSYDFSKGLVQGFFDANGSVQGDQQQGVSIRLCQTDIKRLQSIQRLLLAMGIYSKIFKNRQTAEKRYLPNEKGDKDEFDCLAIHELIISEDQIVRFHDIIGFKDNAKAKLLDHLISQYIIKPYTTKFIGKVETIESIGSEDVYDCTIETIHRFAANGMIAHNCAEILLDSRGVCNLTTLNLPRFVHPTTNGYILDMNGLIDAQKLSVRIGLRMTLITLELNHWDLIQTRDRLLGCSMTGIKDAMDMLDYSQCQEDNIISLLSQVAREEAARYAKELRVSCPLLVTTIKPEGSLSQLAGGVSPGLHFSHSPYYIRRIRINALDPLVNAVKELNWVISPEVGTPGATDEERLKNARTLVIDFPVFSGAKRTKNDITVEEQLNTYFSYQKNYTDHNSSNTITVKPDEWDTAKRIIYSNWDNFVGVSFLSHDGGSYALAPYEECTKEKYEELMDRTKPFDMSLLIKHENKHKDFTLGKMAGGCSNTDDDNTEIKLDENSSSDCAGGVCPIR
mgnify:CR=1 FL=1